MGVLSRWFWGALVPVGCTLWGVALIVSPSMDLPRSKWGGTPVHLPVWAGIALGLWWICDAVFAHCLGFWGEVPGDERPAWVDPAARVIVPLGTACFVVFGVGYVLAAW